MYSVQAQETVTKTYKFSFTCNNEEFMKAFDAMLEKFYNKYDGSITVEEDNSDYAL